MAVHVLLDPIRDSAYLQSLVNPTSTAPDAGVGVIDNPFFFEAGHYSGGISSSTGTSSSTVATASGRRLFFCWFGSPAGTTNESPKFSLFCAKVNEEAFDLDKPAPYWLDQPFLLLSYDQLSRDIINWFDNVMNANGISASGGVASVSSLAYVSGYGYVDGTVNMAGTPQLKQVHFVYDPLDNTVLMYLSMVTPNWNFNQKTIYIYKFPVSLLEQGKSINSYAVNGLIPTTTSTPPPANQPYFLGGFSFDDVFMQSFELYTSQKFPFGQYINFNSPQFTISFDYLGYTKPFGYSLSEGYLPAVMAVVLGNMTWGPTGYSGVNIKGATYPHGDGIVFAVLQDIHNNPAKPTVFRIPVNSGSNQFFPAFSHFPATDEDTYGVNIDKFGSIIPMPSHGILGGYAVPYTTPPRVDFTLASMRMRVMFFEPVTWLNGNQGISNTIIGWFVAASTIESVVNPSYPFMGLCRPYIMTLKDKTFVTLGGYYYDNYINGVAVEVDPKIFMPENYKRLSSLPANVPLYITSPTSQFLVGTGTFTMNGRLFGSFGKKYAMIKLGQGAEPSILLYSYDYLGPSLPNNLSVAADYTASGAFTGNMVVNLAPVPGNTQRITGYISDQTTLIYVQYVTFTKLPISRFNDLAYFEYDNPEIVVYDDE